MNHPGDRAEALSYFMWLREKQTSGDIPEVCALQVDHALIRPQLPGQLPVAHIHRVDLSGPMLKQHVGKAAGGGAAVDAGFACRIHREKRGSEAELPSIPAGKKKKTEYLTVFLIRSGDRTAVRKRPARGLLAGLYEFPNAPGELETEEAVRWLRDNSVEPVRIRRICDCEHIFTHKKWVMRGYEVAADPFTESPIPFIMADAEEILGRYCIPSAFGGYLEWLRSGYNA